MILSIITKSNYTEMTKRELMSKLERILDSTTNILIVEDESILAIGMEYSLEDFGYEVSGIATSYESAIQHVKENTPDLILMDIKIKGDKTGIDAAKVIWQEYKIPVIFLTSYSSEKMISNAMETEPYGYLLKPYREKELKASIEIALYKHRYFFKNRDSLSGTNIIKFIDDITFNKSKGLLYKAEQNIVLTKNEIKLLEILTDHINESVSFEKISDYIWREDDCDIQKLRALIYRMKKKLGVDILENVYEYGYLLKSI